MTESHSRPRAKPVVPARSPRVPASGNVAAHEVELVEGAPLAGRGFDADDDALADAARSETDGEVRQELALELLYRGSPRAYDTLMFLLMDDDPEVRIVAAEGLEDLADPEALPTLRQVLSLETDELVRQALSTSIEALGGGA